MASWYDVGLEKQELLKERIPDCCPFCKEIDAVQWTEFEVYLSDKFYFTSGMAAAKAKPIGAGITVFCTRCEEEIRKEDIR